MNNKNKKSGYAVLSQAMAKLEKTKRINLPAKKSNSSGTSNLNKEKVKGKNSDSENVSKPCVQDKDPNLPDRSFGDYYCTICDSHMNSEDMWSSHINGKKHLKNVKKGDTDSKYEELHTESDIKYELRNVKDPVVGLSYIHEIRRREANVPPFYSCFLCQATLATIPLVIEHVISLKHRLNYVKENDPTEYELLQATNLKKDHLEPLVRETALKLELKKGRGEVLVKQEKPKKPFTMKRGYLSSDEEDDIYQKPVKNVKSNTTEQPHFWKSVDTPPAKVLDDRKERSRSDRKVYFSEAEPSAKYYLKTSSSRDKRDISPGQGTSKSYKRQFETNEYPKRTEYVDDDNYLRQKHLGNNKRSRSPKYEPKHSHTREQVTKDYSPPRSQRSHVQEYYPQSSSHIPGSSSLPHERINESTDETKSFTDASFLKDFLQKVIELPPEVFLKIFLFKMDTMEIKATEELSLLSKIILKAQELVQKNLPRELQDLMKQKYQDSIASGSIDSAAGPSVSTLTTSAPLPPNIEFKPPPKPQDHQSDISFIKDILNSVKSGSPSASSTVSQPASNQQYPNSYQNSQQSLHVTPPYNYGNSSAVNQNLSTINQNLSSINQNLSAQQYINSYQNTQQSSSANPLANTYTSGQAQNVTQGSYPYNSQSNLSPMIPGLSLAGNENLTSQPYNNYQTAPPSTMKNFPYRY